MQDWWKERISSLNIIEYVIVPITPGDKRMKILGVTKPHMSIKINYTNGDGAKHLVAQFKNVESTWWINLII